MDEQLVQSQMQSEVPKNTTHERRSANYKPNIWQYDLLQSLSSEYNEEEYKTQVEKLKEDVMGMFIEAVDLLTKLELIDTIEKLGLANLFEVEIREALNTIMDNPSRTDEGFYATALFFRLLRQHGFNVSQDIFSGLTNKMGTFTKSTNFGMETMLELLEASHLALEGENILVEAKAFSTGILKNIINSNSNVDNKVAKQLGHALELPLHWRVQWYDVKKHIRELENKDTTNSVLLNLAKLNFNMVQATHQKDLKEISRWWENLSLVENASFSRNRLVESYLWAVGVAFEPQHRSFRKWLTKAINFVIIIDDIYDVYGSLEELECFTNSVERWDDKEIQQLPECMKICFQALYNTTNEVAYEIQKEKGWNSALPYLQKVWVDFCKALLVEARWYNKGYTPSLDEYLENGWVSSSGPVLSLHAFFSVMVVDESEELIDLLTKSNDLVCCTSMIIRLCNDLGTSAAELERGDAPSSILCFMKEEKVSEEIARQHIRNTIMATWNKINHKFINKSPLLQPFVKYTINTARVAHFIYQHGDGFGNQDRETRDHVLSLLIEPIKLN